MDHSSRNPEPPSLETETLDGVQTPRSPAALSDVLEDVEAEGVENGVEVEDVENGVEVEDVENGVEDGDNGFEAEDADDDGVSEENDVIEGVQEEGQCSQIEVLHCAKCNIVLNDDLSVELHGSVESLEECLGMFTPKHLLEGEDIYQCNGCKYWVKAWKGLTVDQSKAILTIALNMFQGNRYDKLHQRAPLPVNLNLTKYVNEKDGWPKHYSLYTIVLNINMINGSFFGHYVCCAQELDYNWYRVHNYKFLNVGVEEILARGGYMLLYRKISSNETYVRVSSAKKEAVIDVSEPFSTLKKNGKFFCLACNLESRNVELCIESYNADDIKRHFRKCLQRITGWQIFCKRCGNYFPHKSAEDRHYCQR